MHLDVHNLIEQDKLDSVVDTQAVVDSQQMHKVEVDQQDMEDSYQVDWEAAGLNKVGEQKPLLN